MKKPIYKYTEALQKLSGSKIKPEPWMHFASVKGQYIIYVWDTRAILDSGKVDTEKVITAKAPFAIDNGTPVNGKDAELFNATLFAKPFKLTIEHRNIRNRDYKTYKVDGIEVCETETWPESFCSIDKKTGRRSRLRDTRKIAKQTVWNFAGLRQLFGDAASNVIKQYARNEYPDLRWGTPGYAMTKPQIQHVLEQIRNALAK